jgi:hypothetical protein
MKCDQSVSNNQKLENNFFAKYSAAVRSTALNSVIQRDPADAPLNIARVSGHWASLMVV